MVLRHRLNVLVDTELKRTKSAHSPRVQIAEPNSVPCVASRLHVLVDKSQEPRGLLITPQFQRLFLHLHRHFCLTLYVSG